jgi:hypothetical protein
LRFARRRASHDARLDYHEVLVQLFEREHDGANATAARAALSSLRALTNVRDGDLPRSLIQHV